MRFMTDQSLSLSASKSREEWLRWLGDVAYGVALAAALAATVAALLGAALYGYPWFSGGCALTAWVAAGLRYGLHRRAERIAAARH